VPQLDNVNRPLEDEPCVRSVGRSASELCAGAPAYGEAVSLGAEALLRVVDEDAVRARRLVQMSCDRHPAHLDTADYPFERLSGFLLQDLVDHGVDDVIVCGAGMNGRLFAKLARRSRVRIRCFADNDSSRHHGVIGATPIVSLAEACSIPHLPFVVCTKAHCAAVVSQLALVLQDEARLVFSELSSWRLQLDAADPAVALADTECRALVREAVDRKAPWATAFLLCNFRWFVQQWSAPATGENPVLEPSPFVYRMQ
jgi:hypothetical protein